MKRAAILALLAALAIRCGQPPAPLAAPATPRTNASWRAQPPQPGMAGNMQQQCRRHSQPTLPPPRTCSAALAATPPSYVVSVAHQTAGKQPYPRACNNRAITIAVGSGSSAVKCECAAAQAACTSTVQQPRIDQPMRSLGSSWQLPGRGTESPQIPAERRRRFHTSAAAWLLQIMSPARSALCST